MQRVLSPLLASLAIICCCGFAIVEIKTMLDGPEEAETVAIAPEVEVADPSELLEEPGNDERLENLFGGSDAEKLEGNRRYFVEEFAKKVNLPISALTVGTAVGESEAHIRILCEPSKQKEIDERLDDVQFPLRLLDVREVTLQEKNGKVIEINAVAPDVLGFAPSRELAAYEHLKGFAKPIADMVAENCINHLNLCIKNNPLDPALLAYRWVFKRELGKSTEVDCKLLEGIESNAAEAEPDNSAMATQLKPILCTTNGGAKVDEQAQYIRDNFNPDLTRNYMIKDVYERAGQAEKAAAALQELPRQRQLVNKSLASDLVTCVLTFLAFVAVVVNQNAFFRQPDLPEPVACPLKYGWVKPTLIVGFTAFCVIFGELFMMVAQPELSSEAGLLLASYFAPMNTAISFGIVESMLVLPFTLASVVLVGRKLNFFDYVKFYFKTDKYTTPQLVRVGLECFGLSLAPAMVATLFTYGFHYPWEKASTASTELLVASGSLPAIALMTICYAILAPILEEISFRGIIHPFLRRTLTVWSSVIIGSAIFALAHFEFTPWWIADKFIFAAVNAYALEKTGSIVPGIVNHILTNGFVMLVLYMLVN